MASLKLILLLSLVLAPQALAHFILNTPAPLGNNIDNEGIAPCGGFTPSASDNITNFHVGGDAISLTTLHAQSYFAYLGTLGTSISNPANWTFLIPTVEEYGLNNFCEPSIAVPASWVGSSGLLQVIQDSEDGIHYQCAHVNFVAGIGTSNSACTNSSGVSGQYASDPALATANGQSPMATSTSVSSQASSSTSTAAMTSPTKSAALPMARLDALMSGLLLGVLTVVFHIL